MSHNMSKDAFTEDTLYVLDHALSVIAREHDAVAGVLAHATPNAAQSERTSTERAVTTSAHTKKKAHRSPARASALETVGVPA